MKAPIGIMSFNRPQFLGPVLDSLKAQRPEALEGREVHLFQDGGRNRYSRIRYAQDEDIQACINLFKAAFPAGTVHFAEDNIGIFESFSVAESYFFRERQFDCAYFFEDDLVLSPVYLDMMEILQKFAESSDRVAYFAAYGDHYAKREEVAERRREVVTLDHHWAFGLLRRHWLSMQDELKFYREIVGGNDYSRRDHRAIYDYYRGFGAVPRGSSQDASKAFACDRLGLWRCRTFAPFAKYIGTKGAHMTEEVYHALGFDKTVVIQKPITNLLFPEARQIDRYLKEQHELFVEVFEKELDETVAGLPPRELNPMRLCTREDIEWIYRLLLRREVEDEAIFEQHVGKRPVHILMTAVRNSGEFLGLCEPGAEKLTFVDALSRPPCTANELQKMYETLVHRSPEESVITNHCDVTPLDLLVQGLLRSAELRELDDRTEA